MTPWSFHCPNNAQKVTPPQRFIMPAINPFSTTNKDLSEEETEERLNHYDIPTDLPLIVRVSRFDKWKDPQGVIDAFQIARREIDGTLVLVGNVATDDPEGQEIFESLCKCGEEWIRYFRAGFGARECIAAPRNSGAAKVSPGGIWPDGYRSDVQRDPGHWWQAGGIRHQIADGVNGLLVESVGQAAERRTPGTRPLVLRALGRRSFADQTTAEKEQVKAVAAPQLARPAD